MGEAIVMVEDMDHGSAANEMSAGRRSLKRTSVTQTNGTQALAIHATPRHARVRFEAAVTPLSPKSASPANLHSRLRH